MAIKSPEQLKKWFTKGAYPSESQFADLIDSFIHKTGDEIPISRIKDLSETLTKICESYSLKSDLKQCAKKIAELISGVEILESYYADIKEAIGAPDGIAPLDETGHVGSEYLPSYVDDIVEISGIIDPGIFTNFMVVDEYPEDYTNLKADPNYWPEMIVRDRDYLGAKSIYFVKNGAYFTCGQITELVEKATGEVCEITLVKAPDVDWASMGFEDSGGSARPCVSKIYYNWEDENMYRWTNFSLRAIPVAASGDPSGTCPKCDENEQRINLLESQIQEIYTAIEQDLIPAFGELIDVSSEASAAAQSAESKASEAFSVASGLTSLKLISDSDAVALNDEASQPVGLTGKKRYRLGVKDSALSTDKVATNMHIVLPCDNSQIGRRVLLTDSMGLFGTTNCRIVVSAEDGGVIGGVASADRPNNIGSYLSKWVEVYGGLLELVCTYSFTSGVGKPAWVVVNYNGHGVIGISDESKLSKLNEEYWL